MPRIAAFTCLTPPDLPAAQVMARSLKRLHPDWELWAAIPDLLPDDLPRAALACFDVVLDNHALHLDDRPDWVFVHTAREIAAAHKARALRMLFERGVAQAVYLDPRMAVFAPLAPVLAGLAGASIVLAPQFLTEGATAEAARAQDALVQREGIYNTGLLAVSADATGRRFAEWWEKRLNRACFAEPETGVWLDQKHCDVVPALFARVAILRDPGCNVGPWNLAERQMALDPAGRLTAGGGPLRCLQAPAQGEGVAGELAAWHAREVAAAADRLGRSLPWAYGLYNDDTPVTAGARALYRSRIDLRARFRNPYGVGEESYPEWLAAHHPELLEPAA